MLLLGSAVAATAWATPRYGPTAVLVTLLTLVLVTVVARAGNGRRGLVAAAVLVVVVVRAADPGPTDPAPGRHVGTVQAVADPIASDWSTRVDVRLDGAIVSLRGSDRLGRELGSVQAGDILEVVADIAERTDPRWPPRARLVELNDRRPGGLHWRIANGLRDLVSGGASGLGQQRRALFTGLVYGDDRDQSAVVADDFRGSGLTHLLAVSGQNVAFVLALVGPVIRRFGTRGRFALTLVVLGLFATATRFEASVLRATAMAAVAASATASGREASSRRTLAVAVIALLAWRPQLVESLAFQLSVCASGGIVLLSPRLADTLPGPRAITEPLAVTVAAQLAVTPLLTVIFGPVALVTVPANLAVGWAAAAVMMWGLTGGVVAGLVPPLAPVVHLPTSGLLWWLEVVARAGGRLPLGWVGTGSGLVLLACALVVTARPPLARTGAAVALAVVVISLAGGLRPGPDGLTTIAGGTQVWRSGGAVVVVLDPSSPERALLGELRTAGVVGIDVLILSGGTAREAELTRTLRERHPVGAVWVPTGRRRLDHVTPPLGAVAEVGGLEVSVVASSPRLVVQIVARTEP